MEENTSENESVHPAVPDALTLIARNQGLEYRPLVPATQSTVTLKITQQQALTFGITIQADGLYIQNRRIPNPDQILQAVQEFPTIQQYDVLRVILNLLIDAADRIGEYILEFWQMVNEIPQIQDRIRQSGTWQEMGKKAGEARS